MSLTVKNVNLIRKTNVTDDAIATFLVEALEVCTGSPPGEIEWQTVNRIVRGRTKGEERTITESWQPGPMLDVRRTRVESYGLNSEAELELKGAQISFYVRNLPDEGSIEFRIDNTRLKGASMEVYTSVDNAKSTVDLFTRFFNEA
jgi:hypothetical protein